MIDWIQSNISLFVSMFGGGALLTMAASVVKAFSQSRLNKAFDQFNDNNMSQKLGIGEYINKSKEMIATLENKLDEAEEEIVKLNKVAEEFLKKIDGDILDNLDEKLRELNTMVEQNKLKDSLIAHLSKELKQVNLKLDKIHNEHRV